MGSTVRFDDVVFRYDGSAGGPADFELRVPELAIEAGERVACIGPRGCGKTTLVHLAAGILLPSSGEVRLDGESWGAASEGARRRRRVSGIGLVFQELELLEYLSVRENIRLPYDLHGALRIDGAVRARLDELARTLGLAPLLERHPAALSRGERGRVAACRALLPAPGLILADEPTANLDPDTAERVLTTLLADARERASTLVVVTHDHAHLDAFDRVIDLGRESTEDGS